MNATDYTESKTPNCTDNARVTGETSLRQSRNRRSTVSIANGEPQEKPLLTSRMACEMLGCHITTLYYRVKRGDLKPVYIHGVRYFLLDDVILLNRHNPIRNKPHWSRRMSGPGGGPGDGCIYGSVYVVPEKTKPTLWQRIKALFA
jgi:hypothetical protein